MPFLCFIIVSVTAAEATLGTQAKDAVESMENLDRLNTAGCYYIPIPSSFIDRKS